MSGPRKKTPHPKTRAILAENLKRRIDEIFPHSGNQHGALADKSGVRLSRIQVAANGTEGVSIDIVGRLAEALDCTVADLLTDPNHNSKVPEIVSLWTNTDDLGQSNILQTARAWRDARPRSKPSAP